MSVDVFGRTDKKSVSIAHRGPPGIGYKLTQDGQYDINRKRLCNLAEPLNNNDAVNFHVLKKRMTNNNKKIKDDLTKNFDSLTDKLQKLENDITVSKKLIIETISENFKSEFEKLSQKLDSDTTLIINVIEDTVYKRITQIQSDLENLKNKISLSINEEHL